MPVKWLSKEKSLKLLKKAKYGRLATCDKEKQPYITPLNFVLLNEKIYFHCGFAGQKIDNLKSNPSVCFEVSRLGKLYAAPLAKNFTYRFWSVLVFGTAKQLSDSEMKLTVLNKIMQKYASGYNYKPLSLEDTSTVNIFEIEIEKITGKLSVDPQ